MANNRTGLKKTKNKPIKIIKPTIQNRIYYVELKINNYISKFVVTNLSDSDIISKACRHVNRSAIIKIEVDVIKYWKR